MITKANIELFHPQVLQRLNELRTQYDSDFDRYTGLQDKASERFFRLSTQVTILMMTGWVALLSVGKIKASFLFCCFELDATYPAAFSNFLHVLFLGVMVYSNHLAATMQTLQEFRVTKRFQVQYDFVKKSYEAAMKAHADGNTDDFLKFARLTESVSEDVAKISDAVEKEINPKAERAFKIFSASLWLFVGSTAVSLLLLILSIKLQ